MYFKRNLSSVIDRYEKYPVIAILGPRQSGKTTLAKHYFKEHKYVNLENPENRRFAKEDPNSFLNEYKNKNGIIIDEFQYVPELLSYIQVDVDENKIDNYFILTGSQNFLMNQSISQSLAGRVGILTLLPLSIDELEENNLILDTNQTLVKGFYPSVYQKNLKSFDFYPGYIQTYIEKDVRQVANIGDIVIFQKFMQLCAARIGQQLNIADIAINLGQDQRTVKKWLSILDSSYITFFLQPYFRNFNKRVTKTPKLYFYDTGLALSLLNILSSDSLTLNPYKGAIFENMIIADVYKQYFNLGLKPSLYFWRDKNGRIEVDGLIDQGGSLTPVEIKAGQTISHNFFKSLSEWNKISDTDPSKNILIYSGKENQKRSLGHVIGWQKSGRLIKSLYKKLFE